MHTEARSVPPDVVVDGDLADPTAPLLSRATASAIERTPRRPIVIDLSAVDVVDIAGMRALTDAAEVAGAAGRGVTIRDAPTHVLELLRLLGIEQHFAFEGATGIGTAHVDPGLLPGTGVEVRTAFDDTWARGFEVAGIGHEGYRIRRLSDGSALPSTFERERVRLERRTDAGWAG